jgi:hypothetical protein
MIRILQRIEFDTNRATLRPTAEPILEEVWQALSVNPQITEVQIGGHTDSRGPDQKNLTLSQQRAETVMRWLTDHGIEPERFEAKGFGESVPLVEGNDEEAWQQNRRVEFKIMNAPPAETAPPPTPTPTRALTTQPATGSAPPHASPAPAAAPATPAPSRAATQLSDDDFDF